MSVGIPLQFVLPATYDTALARKQTSATGRPRSQQDEATKAWNIHTALYYKAGGFPWSLVRDTHDLDSCFIGISFYFDTSGNLATSTAQVFDERGEGIIVRGGPAKLSKGDNRPYLDAPDAEKLLLDALKRYRVEHHNLPARVVIHKSTQFRREEIEGLQRAADAERITDLELVALGPSGTRVSPASMHRCGARRSSSTSASRSSTPRAAFRSTSSTPAPTSRSRFDHPATVGAVRRATRPRDPRADKAQLEQQPPRRPRSDHHARRAQHRHHPPTRPRRRHRRRPLRLLHVANRVAPPNLLPAAITVLATVPPGAIAHVPSGSPLPYRPCPWEIRAPTFRPAGST